MSTGPFAWADSPVSSDDSTAGPSGPTSIGPRKGLAYLAQPEACLPDGTQPSALGYVANDEHRVYGGSEQ